MVKQISDNEIYLLIKCIKSVHCRLAKRLSYIEDARCLKVNWRVWSTSSIPTIDLIVVLMEALGLKVTCHVL